MTSFIKLKENIYNSIIKPLKNNESNNIQFIIRYQDEYCIASQKPITNEELEQIKFDELEFKRI